MKNPSIRIVLASKSPRRRELLCDVAPDFEIITEEVDETLPDGMHPRDGVGVLAVRKGAAVAATLPSDCLVISSDTLVELDGIPLGKPTDTADACRILRSLSGKTHNVHTGVAVHYLGGVYHGVATSSVTFRELTDAEIRDYVATGEPMDKAGAYGIQGLGGALVLRYDGDFDTIVGLSRALTQRLINEAMEKENE